MPVTGFQIHTLVVKKIIAVPAFRCMCTLQSFINVSSTAEYMQCLCTQLKMCSPTVGGQLCGTLQCKYELVFITLGNYVSHTVLSSYGKVIFFLSCKCQTAKKHMSEFPVHLMQAIYEVLDMMLSKYGTICCRFKMAIQKKSAETMSW